SPVCSSGQVSTFAVGRYEDAEVTCTVEANPVLKSFQWTFNNTADTIDVPKGRYTSTGSQSIITYTPMTSLDYGTLLCSATNPIGTQKDPCVFHILPAGTSGGLSQVFLLQASLQERQHQHHLNVTSSTIPNFS
ncbi:putative Immunoglobulin domain-containing protein 5, partial [Homarus americanus]